MRVRSLLLAVGLLGIASVASFTGCGGANPQGITVPGNSSRDLGGFVVPSQGSSSGDMAQSTDPSVNADFATPGGSQSGCGSVTGNGSCNGNTVTYCDPSTDSVQTIDCASQGLVCATDGSGLADCTTDTSGGSGGSSSCGTVDKDGICSGDTLKYCNSSNTLVTKDCSASGKSCVVTSSGYAKCN